ncbi:hypothetical protein D3C72_1482220 [compost metagenome]
MLVMIPLRRASTSSRVQERRWAFWLISRPEVATPPALAALPGANSTRASWKTLMAAALEGMLAPSATSCIPLATKAAASSASSSFWVAQGRATSACRCQGVRPVKNSSPSSWA